MLLLELPSPQGVGSSREPRPPQAALAAAAHSLLLHCVCNLPRSPQQAVIPPRPRPAHRGLRSTSTKLLTLASSVPCVVHGPQLRLLPARATPGPEVVDAPKVHSRQRHPPVQPAQLSTSPPLLTELRHGLMQAPTPSSQTSYNTVAPGAAHQHCCVRLVLRAGPRVEQQRLPQARGLLCAPAAAPPLSAAAQGIARQCHRAAGAACTRAVQRLMGVREI